MDDAQALLRQARDELYHAKALVRATRNHTQVSAAALHDSEQRIDALIRSIEVPTPKEAQEHDPTHSTHTQARR
jgi:hypothetical protein